ncbi:MAG TPA: hypothetical protein VL380_09565 [Nitrosospira sp.]|jgi:hypothetical protein|nr:hypothetical protein [Nitrosospira sp.]
MAKIDKRSALIRGGELWRQLQLWAVLKELIAFQRGVRLGC